MNAGEKILIAFLGTIIFIFFMIVFSCHLYSSGLVNGYSAAKNEEENKLNDHLCYPTYNQYGTKVYILSSKSR